MILLQIDIKLLNKIQIYMNNLRNKICCNEDGDLKNKEEYIAVG